MALQKGKTEHGGHKGSGRKDGFIGYRADAKVESKKLRRHAAKKIAYEAKRNPPE